MSTAEPASESSAREHPGCVVGISVGLLLCFALVVQLAVFRAHVIDPEELLAELFVDAQPPYSLVVREAAALPDGTRTLLLDADEASRAEWRAAGGHEPPTELALLLHPSASPVRRQFAAREGGGKNDERARWQASPDFAYDEFLDAGELYWDEWRAVWYRERRFGDDGEWRDRVCLNLSAPDRWLVMSATWPAGEDAEEDALGTLLEAWTLR